MAFITYPVDGPTYSAEDAELYFCTRKSGVYSGRDFSPGCSGTDNTVTIGPGIAWIKNADYAGKVAASKTEQTIDLGLPDSALPRIDTIVIRWSAASLSTELAVKKGNPANSPVALSPSRTASLYELQICEVHRPAGATKILPRDIKDTRLVPYACGLMADPITQIDTSAISAQVSDLIADLRAEIGQVRDGSAYLLRTGGTMEGGLNMGGNSIRGLPRATDPEDPVTVGDLLRKVYPVGSIYLTVAAHSPAAFIGGDWTPISGRFLIGAGDGYINRQTGGEAEHTLTVEELPTHDHQMSDGFYSAIGGQAIRASYPADSFDPSIPQSVRTQPTGGGKAHNNLPPYLVVMMWKRVG